MLRLGCGRRRAGLRGAAAVAVLWRAGLSACQVGAGSLPRPSLSPNVTLSTTTSTTTTRPIAQAMSARLLPTFLRHLFFTSALAAAQISLPLGLPRFGLLTGRPHFVQKAAPSGSRAPHFVQ